MIARTKIRWCCISVFIFLGAVGTVATDTPEQVTRKLAGSNAREWVFKKWKTFLGAGDRCQQGESYRFTAQHRVTISTCPDGHVHKETKNWSIDTHDALDTIITIGDTSFVLVFWENKDGHFMMLRTKPKVKTDRVVQKEFQLDEESL
jgi:hypothetical protein